MTRFSILRRTLGVALILLVPAVAAAESPKEFVTAKYRSIVEQLAKPPSKARDEAVSAQIQDGFDFKVIASDSLGNEQWEKLKDTERQEFQELLGKLVQQSYRKSLGQTLGYTLEVKEPEPLGGSRVKVPTVVTKDDKGKKSEKGPKDPKNDKPKSYLIDYTLAETNGKWKIVDTVIEGSSMVTTYRSQFRRVLKNEGYEALVAKMKKRLAKGEK
jgi:phospholipid transport system substrate-binding protein